MELKNTLDAFRRAIKDKTVFSTPPERPALLFIMNEMESILEEIQSNARNHLRPFENHSGAIKPTQEALQIIIGNSIEALETLQEIENNISEHQKQGQLIKGLTQLLDWTTHLDYAKEGARKLLRLAQRIANQLTRIEGNIE